MAEQKSAFAIMQESAAATSSNITSRQMMARVVGLAVLVLIGLSIAN